MGKVQHDLLLDISKILQIIIVNNIVYNFDNGTVQLAEVALGV